MSSEHTVSTPNLDQLIDSVITHFQAYKNNFTNQVNEAFTHLTPKDMIRLVIIAGAYCLLRPYLIKAGAKFQARDHERELDHEEIQEMRRNEGYNKESLKGKVDIPEDTDTEGEEQSTSTGTNWGKKARRRQRDVLRRLLEEEERRRLEDEEAESDKELEEFLTR